MSRKSGFTGANAVPLGPRNPAMGSKRTFSSAPPPQQQPSLLSPKMMSYPKQETTVSSNAANALRAAQAAAANLAKLQQNKSMEKPPEPAQTGATDEGRGRAKKRKSRWGTPDLKTDIPGIPAKIPANLTTEQQQAYIVQLQIEDVTRKLKSGDLGIPANPEDRSPSPEPIYNNEGKRLNTREYRTRKHLEEERHKLIQDMTKLNENYKPPMDYKPPIQRISEQIMIPADLNPSINFVGLLIGPRGNTLKKIEKECICKIMIRGKGSVKEGKIGRKDGLPLPGEDEPLHALITGTTIENVQKACKEIHQIIKQGIEQPEGQNDLRKLQLMELARLNGTLRDDALPREREWLKPENQNITNTTVCTKCGGRGHIAQDCLAVAPSVGLQQPDQPEGANMNPTEKAKMDSEYMSLMAELGEGPGPAEGGGNDNQANNNQFGGPRPPWMSGPRGPPFGGSMGYNGPQGPYSGQQNMMGGPPPWMRGGQRGRGNFRGRGRGQFRGGGDNYNYQGGGYNQGGYNQGYYQGGGNMPWMNQYDNSMSYNNNMDGSVAPLMNPPPPPPPGNAPQQPPLPPGSNAPWQQNQNWNQDQSGENAGGDNKNGGSNDNNEDYSGGQNSGSNMGSNNMGGNNMGSNNMGGDGSNMGDQSGNMGGNMGNNMMGGYGNMMGYGMWGGMGNMGGNMGNSGMAQPPMPPGPGPVSPPPPTSGTNSSTSQSGNNQWGMDYNNMGMMGGMGMMPFGMAPAPPPPPPSS